MIKAHISLTVFALIALTISTVQAKTPLKVYILAGQSNMEGQVYDTINAMRNDPEVAELYKDMTDKDGNPITVDNAYIVYGDLSGKLTSKFGTTWYHGSNKGVRKMGPEYTFGIYMQKHLKEPFLIIKTAWGGMDLLQQFRSPSAGAYEIEADRWGNPTGHKYRQMIKAVKDVLADPGKYHPAYDKAAGYEIAGFVWFQGYNDMINTAYYRVDRKDKKSAVDYSEYTRLMACFIRDVRKDLSAPDMKFVIGAIGISGDKDKNQVKLAKAQAATADMPEFKGNVAAVYTAKYWDHKLASAAGKMKRIDKDVWRGTRGKSKEEKAAYRAKLIAERLTEEEAELSQEGVSNEPYHYLGSAKIVGRIGKAFADAMHELETK